MSRIQLEPSWKSRLLPEFSKPYMKGLKAFLTEELSRGKTIYPKGKEYFRALDLAPFDKVRLAVIGQDPYHGPHQAHGLCFSVRMGIPPPPSLVNIYRELKSDLGIPIASHGCLEAWARQGALLLNSSLTVEARRPSSHRGRGWEEFTDRIISLLNGEKEHIVFLLWGRHAAEKARAVDESRHCVLKAPHPSPFSADRGFFGCRHFSRANDYLKSHGLEPIDWSAHLNPVSAPAAPQRLYTGLI